MARCSPMTLTVLMLLAPTAAGVPDFGPERPLCAFGSRSSAPDGECRFQGPRLVSPQRPVGDVQVRSL